MLVVLGKDNGFANLVTIVHFNALFHEDCQYLANGVFIENLLIQCRTVNRFGHFAIIIGKQVFVCFLVFFGQVIINNALFHEFQSGFNTHKINQEPVLNCLCQLITISRNTIFQFKDTVCVFVDFIPRSGSQANKVGIEICKNVFVLVIDTAVCFIANDKVKVSDSIEFAPVFILGIINAVNHCLIGGENTTGIIIFLVFAEIDHGQVRQQVHKCSFCLCDQTVSVSKEQNILDPSMSEKNIHNGNCGSGLAGTRCHNKECFSAVLGIKSTANCLDCFFLIITTRNVIADTNIRQTGSHGEFVKLFLQISFGVDTTYTVFGVVAVIPDTGVKTVGQEDNRSATKFLFQ